MIELRAGRILPWAVLPALLLLAGKAPAQDNNAECVLRGRDTVIAGGITVKACLNVDALNGQNIEIPSNVTRIDNTGFSLCEDAVNQGGLADIVYVMDQSGSMSLDRVWISPDGRDTVYVHGTGQGVCPTGTYTPADRDNFGELTVLSQDGVRQVRKLNPAKDPRALCTDFWSGDPFSQRAIALRGAIDFQALRAPGSRAGYVGFAGSLAGTVTPRTLNTAANVTAVKQPIDIRNAGGDASSERTSSATGSVGSSPSISTV